MEVKKKRRPISHVKKGEMFKVDYRGSEREEDKRKGDTKGKR